MFRIQFVRTVVTLALDQTKLPPIVRYYMLRPDLCVHTAQHSTVTRSDSYWFSSRFVCLFTFLYVYCKSNREFNVTFDEMLCTRALNRVFYLFSFLHFCHNLLTMCGAVEFTGALLCSNEQIAFTNCIHIRFYGLYGTNKVETFNLWLQLIFASIKNWISYNSIRKLFQCLPLHFIVRIQSK